MTEPTYNMKKSIRDGLAECRDELEVPSSICSTDVLLDHVLEARNLSAPQCLVLGVFLTMHAQTAIEQATARHEAVPLPETSKEWQPLVGQSVHEILLSADGETLRLHTDAGCMNLPVDGECCSSSWWNDIISVKQLLGATVTAVEYIDMPDVPAAEAREEDQDYGVKVTTDRGVCTLVYRNSSNGWYGGSCYPRWYPTPELPPSIKLDRASRITEDYSA